MKNIHVYVTVLATIFCMSCKEYLDVKPVGKTLPKTAEEFSALLQTHLADIDEAKDSRVLGDSYSVLFLECCTDNMNANLTIYPYGNTLPSYMGSEQGRFRDTYKELYKYIRDCNIVIDNMEERDSELGKKVLATAYTMRAVCYFNLLRLYCEPYKSDQAGEQLGLALVKTFDMEEKAVRSDMESTIRFIESDLLYAIDYDLQENIYRFTVDVAKAYLARLYFWAQDYRSAIPWAKELLVKYPLLAGQDYINMIQSRYNMQGNELIRSYRMPQQLSDMGYDDCMKTLVNYRPLSKEFVELFAEKDNDVRYAISFNKKRMSLKNISGRVRTDEMCLVLAESYAHLSRADSALYYLNHLRKNRIADCQDYTEATLPEVDTKGLVQEDATGKSLTKLMAAILNERRKELFMENDRWYELKRNGRPEFWAADNGRKMITAKYLYTQAFPKEDIELNPGLIQNEGYK